MHHVSSLFLTTVGMQSGSFQTFLDFEKAVLISGFGTFNLLFSFSKITNWKLYLGRKWRTETFGSVAVFSIFSEWMLFNQFGSSLSIIQHCFQFLLGRLLAPLRNVFGGTTKSIMVFLKKGLLIKSKSVFCSFKEASDLIGWSSPRE